MKKYEYLSHTSEEKFAAYGKTVEEAFCNAALAVENIIVQTDKVKPIIKKKIIIETKHLKGLLFDFLQELLILFDSEHFIIHKITDMHIQQKERDYVLECNAHGDNAKQYSMLSGVKSVTYNEMEIKQEKELWTVTAVVDV
ncbi:MAG: archease [Candidatus Woesearchaeota archaeon]|jgi:SHS2 domain-containing protein